MIYFIQSEQYVKIGYTSNLKARYKKYVTENPNPVRLLGSIKGGMDIEKKLHKRFGEFKHNREWFHLNDTVRAMIIIAIEEGKDNIEPAYTKVRRDKYRHLKTLSMLKDKARANGQIEINREIRNEICTELEIATSTFTRHLSKLVKTRKLTLNEGVYYLV